MTEMTLVIGNRNYSSWSLRAYLALKATGAPFREVVIPLSRPETEALIAAHSPSGKVPVLRHGDVRVWESLAICEYLAELFPEARLWPEARAARAFARAIAAEMHAGFAELRRNLPMDLIHDGRARSRAALVAGEIARVLAIWREARRRFGEPGANGEGPFLLGGFSAADAMFAPVATRLRTYGVTVDADAAAYIEAIHAWPAFGEWLAAARAEPWVIDYPVFRSGA